MELSSYEKSIASDVSSIGTVVASVSSSVSKTRADSIVTAITHFFYSSNKSFSSLSPAGAIFNKYGRDAREMIWLCKLIIAQIIFETRWMESEQWLKTHTAGVIARPGVTVDQWLSPRTIGDLFGEHETDNWFTGNKIKVYKNFYFEAKSKQIGVKILSAYLVNLRQDYGSTVKKRMTPGERILISTIENKAKKGLTVSDLDKNEFKFMVRANAMRWQSGSNPQDYLKKIESIATNNIKIAII